jgi:class 3 adenylate cyclase
MASPARARPPLWALLLLALPLAGLAVLITQPRLDVRWEHHPAHFWLVVISAALNAVLAYATGTAARRRGDARVFLVSLAFLCAAGFLGLHALATPQVLLEGKNAGFSLATPVGLLGAGALAAASSATLTADRAGALMRRAGALQNGLVAVMAAWAAVSLASVAPLDNPAAPERASGPLLALAAGGVVLYAIAVVRYLRLHARRPAGILVVFASAFALLAEAMAAVAIGRNWHATWWEWHGLMLVAFGLVAYSAHRQWHEERFSDLYLDDTAAGRRDVSVLFADLQGFTHFSETRDPGEVSEMLNTYFQVAIPPVVERHGGTIDRLVGDALMATFNRNGDQPDHVERAARAALAIQEATARIADDHPDWPRFRAAVNTGEAMVGVVGTAGGRTHTVIGDTVNLAARLEGKAPVGGVAIGPETARRLTDARTKPLGALPVKGKSEPVEVHLLVALES